MIVKGRKIVNRVVVGLSEAAEIGSLDNVIFDREARMAAIVIRKRGHSKEQIVTAIDNVHALGRDAITLEQGEAIEGSENVEELQSSPNLRQLIGCRVITEGGIYLGRVRDLLLDPEARRITDFDLVGRGVWGRMRGDRIPATGHMRFGREIVIVPNRISVKGPAVLEEIAAPAVQPIKLVELKEPIVLSRATEQPAATAEPEENGLTRAVGA